MSPLALVTLAALFAQAETRPPPFEALADARWPALHEAFDLSPDGALVACVICASRSASFATTARATASATVRTASTSSNG